MFDIKKQNKTKQNKTKQNKKQNKKKKKTLIFLENGKNHFLGQTFFERAKEIIWVKNAEIARK